MPHIVEHVRHEVPGDGDQGDEVALSGRLAVEVEIVIPEEPEYVSAVGAALVAADN